MLFDYWHQESTPTMNVYYLAVHDSLDVSLPESRWTHTVITARVIELTLEYFGCLDSGLL
jgi:hypothetical protein